MGPALESLAFHNFLLCVVCESQKFPCTWAVFCGVVWIFQLYWRGCPDFLSNFTVQSSHTQMIFEKFQRFHTPQFGAHTGKFSDIVIFPKQIESFLIGNFLSIWPTHKEFFPYMRIFRKINPLWYESFEKPYEGFS